MTKPINAIIYNVSHSDVIYGMPSKSTSPGQEPLARASFSHFYPVSNQILAHVRSPTTKVSIELGQRTDGRPPSPVGLRLSPPLKINGVWDNFRYRDRTLVNETLHPEPLVHVVYFPLIATSVPEWVEQTSGLHQRDPSSCTKIIYLVSGSGSPRNVSHDRQDNSTRAASELIADFLRHAFDKLEIIAKVVHSQDDVFRCRDNVEFVNHHLRPLIDAHRRRLANEKGEDWNRFMHITIALTDGAPARIQALQACLRNYRPVFLHVWQLKSFWYNRTMSNQDIDFQTFEDMETRPPVNRSSLTPDITDLVNEMIAYKSNFDNVRSTKDHELHEFWLRKTKKPVLSVLMVELDEPILETATSSSSTSTSSTTPTGTKGAKGTKGKRFQFFRGINCEVSMPTGSLCSERNAIGTALATNTHIRRDQFKAVAILSTSKVCAVGKHKPRSPRKTPKSLSSSSSLSKSLSSSSSLLTQRYEQSPKILENSLQFKPSPSSSTSSTSNLTSSSSSRKRAREEEEEPVQQQDSTSMDAWRIKRLRARSVSSEQESPVVVGLQTGTIQVEGSDLNPIAPCGACSEWLKKIAEVNPDFRVIMFEDTTCETVFVRNVWGT